MTSPQVHVAKAFRKIRPGKTWAVAFKAVNKNVSKHEHAFLKLAGAFWFSTHNDTLDVGYSRAYWEPGPAKWPEFSGSNCKEKGPQHQGTLKWSGAVGSVMSESLVYHVSKVLGLYSVPPGKIVALTPKDMGLHWSHEHLCTDHTTFAKYATHLENTVPSPIMYGWLQVAAPELKKTGEVGLHGCMGFCSKEGFPPGKDNINCTDPENVALDCCVSRDERMRGETHIVHRLVGATDLKTNCFAAKYGSQYHHVNIDNDNI